MECPATDPFGPVTVPVPGIAVSTESREGRPQSAAIIQVVSTLNLLDDSAKSPAQNRARKRARARSVDSEYETSTWNPIRVTREIES